MFVILQHRHEIKTDHPNSPNNDHNNGIIDLAWFSQGRPKLTSITTTPSELEGYGYESVNGSAMELNARREHHTPVAFSRLGSSDNHRDREKREDGKPRTSGIAGAEGGGIELQLSVGQGGTGPSNPRLS
jgi:hypothetical protein